MSRLALLFASAGMMTLASPAAAQSMQGMDHSSMPGMGKPTKPAAKSKAPEPKPSPAPPASGCTAEHAKMGHCALEPVSPAKPDPDAMPGMDMAKPSPQPSADPDCPPEHAKMGHCTPKPSGKPVADTTQTGTDLPPGDAPAPAPPDDWYADRLFPPSEMARSRDEMMKENGGQKIAFLSFNLAEYQVRQGRDGYRWDGEGWYGGDINRVTVKSEGEGTFGKGVEEAEVQLLYSRAIDPYFNLQAGVRQDLGSGPKRTYATIGFEGLAPYWFEVEGALFLSNKGDVLGRFEGYYDQRITQRLIVQPRAEVNFALQNVPESGIGSGLSDVELGLRLRYEVKKEFAPYIGVEWVRKIGDTARFARAAGEDANVTNFVAGIRFWF
jgi:copper resistance protein B